MGLSSKNIIRDSVTYTEHAKRKTVTALDVVYALKVGMHATSSQDRDDSNAALPYSVPAALSTV